MEIKSIQVHLSAQTHAAIVAAKGSESISSWVLKAIEAYLNANPGN